MPEGYAGEYYEAKLTATGSGSIAFSAEGLPSWLKFTDNTNGTALLSGTPGASDYGIYTITVSASNSDYRYIKDFSLTIWRSEDEKNWGWDWQEVIDSIVKQFTGGGGCNVGLGSLALLMLGTYLLRKR